MKTSRSFSLMLLAHLLAGISVVGSCDTGWLEYSGTCYYVGQSKATWYDAAQQCQSMEARLASILNEEEMNFIMNITDVNNADYWIGLRRTNINKRWKWIWSDGSNMSYTNWLKDEPSGSGNCGLIAVNNSWSDGDCSSNLYHGKQVVYYLCKKAIKAMRKYTEKRDKTETNYHRYTQRHGMELVLPLVLAAVVTVLIIVIDFLIIYYCRRMKKVQITRKGS